MVRSLIAKGGSNKRKEPLINSGTVGLQKKMVQLKARIAVNSGAIDKIRNEEMGYFRRNPTVPELIRGSFNLSVLCSLRI